MTPDEHKRVVGDEAAGRVLIGVDRSAARKFFTQADHDTIRRQIGESLYLDRAIVTTSFVLGFLLLLTAIGVSTRAFGWWSILIAPITALVGLTFWSMSSVGNARIYSSLAAVGCAAGVYFLAPLPWTIKLWLLALASALFFLRFTYSVAAFLLRALVIRNWRALRALEGGAVVVHRVS